jgi:amidase
MSTRVHAFTDDALGDHDAVGLAGLVRDGDATVRELAEAAAARARQLEPRLHAIAYSMLSRPRLAADPDGALYGVPTFVKDNTDLAGVPTGHGSGAFHPHPARHDGRYARQLLSTGMTVLGKSRMPEFGFNPSTEFEADEPTRNPWNTDYSVGASSGGSAAMVAAGAVPIAHANDGGGSIRIPAACAGLVGLKPSRHRHLDGELARILPINMISEGVVSRSVRDTATYLAALENYWRNPALPPIGLITGPARRSLRIGLVLDTVTDGEVDAPTRAAVLDTAALLEAAGHRIEPIAPQVTEQFAADFVQYLALLAELACRTGRFIFDRSFDPIAVDGLTAGLRAFHRANPHRTPGALCRLRRSRHAYARTFARLELTLSPTLGQVAPPLGYLSPTVPYDELIARLRRYVAYTPLNNITGTPAISLPMGMSRQGVPIGVQLSAAYGDERTLLEVAYELEQARPFPRITD